MLQQKAQTANKTNCAHCPTSRLFGIQDKHMSYFDKLLLSDRHVILWCTLDTSTDCGTPMLVDTMHVATAIAQTALNGVTNQ